MTREETIKQIGLVINNHSLDVWQLKALTIAVSTLRPVSREQVEKVWRGEWKHYLPSLGAGNIQCRCTKCGRTPDVETPFCAWCGAPMTDDAVQILLKRMEELKDES